MERAEADLLSLEKIKRGEEAGLTELMSRHKEAVFRFVYRYVQNEADASELTEETFFRVYTNAAKYRPRAKVVTWIFAIAGNLCRDLARRNRKRKGEQSLHAPVSASDGPAWEDLIAANAGSPRENAVGREALQAIESAIQALPHKLKFPFLFCVLEEHSYDACAEILKTTRKTVETRIYRARKQLQEALGGLISDF